MTSSQNQIKAWLLMNGEKKSLRSVIIKQSSTINIVCDLHLH